uniref:BHLH domain-containing protein n=1 Tax=Ciona intestinalis TaxID=7719 RepID=F6Y7H6_CIOIN
MVKVVRKSSKLSARQDLKSLAAKSISISREGKVEEPIVDDLLRKLKAAVPAVNGSSEVTSLEIIQHAIFYIHDLWSTLSDEVMTSYPVIHQTRLQAV